MKKTLWKRSVSFLLMLAMVATMLPSVKVAALDGGYLTIPQIQENNRISIPQTSQDEEVEFLVELDEAPLSSKTLDEIIQAGSIELLEIRRQQEVLARAIEGSDTQMEITHQYQVVLNGFAVKAPASAKAELEAMDGVRRVEVGQRYELPTTEISEEEITSGSLIDSDRANAEGYTGKGTLTAILDTGLDIGHQAFANAPAEPVYSAQDVEDLLSTQSFKAQATGAEVYQSAKIPFAYDYADKDADVSDSMQHGTHVAGTVGANSDGFRGVAPDTQLCIMKVFSDVQQGASDGDILAALEDCVLLQVDAINMSLGSPCGFTSGGEIVDAVYNRVRDLGINLMVAAGNDESSMAGNLIGTNLALVANPDYSIVGSPSTYPAAMSVASVNEMLSKQTSCMLGDVRVPYYDGNEMTELAFAKLEGVYAYVRVGGVGNAIDFSKVDVNGKIALVERGEIPFTEKEQNAKDAGAIGLIVYDNQEGPLFGMKLNGLLPAVSITKADGKLLKNAEVKELDISMKHCGKIPDPEGGQMSSFSSIGVSPDLSLKPEITAPGGNVYSTLPGGIYGDMSGTSMACPHMAGAAAVVRQYVDGAFADKTEQEKQFILNALLMSTADPVLDHNGVPFTPRKQGAGLAQIYSAIHSGAYLTVSGSDRTKAELGDNSEGSYSFTFQVVNFSDTEKSYTVDALPLVADVVTVNGYDCISNYCRLLTKDEFAVSFSQDTVTVPANGTVSVDVTLTLTEAGKNAVSLFPNGIYMEGFVTLTPVGEGEDLSLPYLGFYGDWGKVPMFDANQYTNPEDAIMSGCGLAMMNYEGQGNFLGVDGLTNEFHQDRISYASFTANKAYMYVTPILGLLRAPDAIHFTVTPENEPENVIYDVTYPQVMKSFYYAAGDFIYTPSVSWDDAWNGALADAWLPDGMYNYHIDATAAGTNTVHSLNFPICIDNQAPEVVSTRYYVENDVPFLEVTLHDNHFVMLAQLVNPDGTKALSQAVSVEQNAAGDETTVLFGLQEIQDAGEKLCRVDMIDYAWNRTTSDLISTTSQDIEAIEVKMGTSRITARTDSNDSEIIAYIDPSNAKDQTLTWSSSNEAVAKVVSVSEDTHTAVISFIGAGSCQIQATASNGVFGITQVDVSEASNPWPQDNVIRENGVYYIPDLSPETMVTVTDNALDVTLVGKADKVYENLFIHSKNAGLHLTIRDLQMSNGGWSSNNAIAFQGAGNILTLQGENAMTAHDYMSYAMVRVDNTTELTVNGDGTLALNSAPYCDGAGIGGDPGQAAGKITIESGIFKINTPGGGAAIGAGCNNGEANIIILGGEFDMQMPLLTGYPSNQQCTGAAIGSGYYAMDGMTKIRIDGGHFTGFTGVDSAIIGLGFKSSNTGFVDVNGGSFDLRSEADSLHGGACIGTALPDGGNYAALDITVNGGEIHAVSNSDAAAIGGGAGHKTGSIYVNGGTITAESTKGGDAIGHGVFADDGNIRVSSGTVKTLVTGTGNAFGDATLTNEDSDDVSLVTLSAPNVQKVLVDGVDWKISANHPEDADLYLYLTAAEHSVTVTDETGEHLFAIGADGTVTPIVDYAVSYVLENLTAEGPETVRGGETLTVTLSPAEGYALPETLSVTVGDAEAVYTYENGVITLENVQGDVVVTASAVLLADKAGLEAALADAKALNAEQYTSDSWTAVETAISEAEAVLADKKADQAAVDAATDALNAAIQALILRGDKTALEEALTEARALEESRYTSESWAQVADAMQQAQAVLDNADATQEDVDAAVEALKAAVDALISRGDKAALEALLENAKGQEEALYTSDSWKALEAAMNAAQKLLDDPDALQEELDAAAEELEAAMNALVLRGDKQKLLETLEEASKLDPEAYTSASWKALEAAEKAARKVSDNADALQEEIDSALEALTDAMNALVLRGDKAELQANYDIMALDMSRLEESVFEPALWAAAEQAMDAAELVLSNVDATQAEIDLANTILTEAYKAIQEYPVNDRYTDVNQKEWYNNAIDFVTRYGIMNGMKPDEFAPKTVLTRGQMVTILYRLEGSPAVEGETGFTDVKDSEYYAPAVLWAVQNGITDGVGHGLFAPKKELTRQEMVTFMMRYAQHRGMDTEKRGDLSGFEDADHVLDYAKEAMEWAVAEGLVKGMGHNNLAPKAATNRAQMAELIARMCRQMFW